MSETDSGMDKMDIEELLIQGETVQIKPQGYSMYPVLVPGRDEVVVAPVNPDMVKRGDVSILVLHRIWKRKGSELYLVGDNQKEIEGPLRPDQVRGIMTELIRKGRRISADNIIYRVLTRIWLFLRPLRPLISHTVARCKRFFLYRRKHGNIVNNTTENKTE